MVLAMTMDDFHRGSPNALEMSALQGYNAVIRAAC